MLRATCEPSRFLDLIESFLLFEDARGGLRKIVAKYHQVLGVNRAIEAVEEIGENRGRLGVFWHTQGSGKSLSTKFSGSSVVEMSWPLACSWPANACNTTPDQVAPPLHCGRRVGRCRRPHGDCGPNLVAWGARF